MIVDILRNSILSLFLEGEVQNQSGFLRKIGFMQTEL